MRGARDGGCRQKIPTGKFRLPYSLGLPIIDAVDVPSAPFADDRAPLAAPKFGSKRRIARRGCFEYSREISGLCVLVQYPNATDLCPSDFRKRSMQFPSKKTHQVCCWNVNEVMVVAGTRTDDYR